MRPDLPKLAGPPLFFFFFVCVCVCVCVCFFARACTRDLKLNRSNNFEKKHGNCTDRIIW